MIEARREEKKKVKTVCQCVCRMRVMYIKKSLTQIYCDRGKEMGREREKKPFFLIIRSSIPSTIIILQKRESLIEINNKYS